MKNYIYITMITIGLIMSSCGEEFLEKAPSGSLPANVAIQNSTDMETVLLGAYSQLQNSDYYGRYIILVPDVMSDDVKQNSSANRAKDWAEYNGNSLDGIAEEIWTEVYEAINRVNTVINAEVELEASDQAAADQIIGEALALRGLAHFDLVRVYGQHYGFTQGASHPGVPIVTSFDESALPTRSTVGEVYAAVISDLQQGISKMSDSNPKAPGRMSKLAAQALLARVYFYMEDYQKAAAEATAVIDAANALVAGSNYVKAWTETGHAPDALFSVIMTAEDNNGSDALGRMYINEGYGDYLPSDDLRSLIDPADIRGSLYKPDSTLGGGDFGWDRVNKFPSTTGEDNTPVIRLAEVYLIRAESLARLGDDAGATADLMTIRSRAWSDAPDVTATGDALIEEIIKERRIELAFEGNRLWDLMRLKRSVERTDCTSSECSIAYPNDRFILPIPQAEIDANPNMQQNSGY